MLRGLFKTPRRSLCSGLWRPSDARMCSAGPPPASSAHPERLSPLSATRNLLVPVPAPPPRGYPFTECPACSVGTHKRTCHGHTGMPSHGLPQLTRDFGPQTAAEMGIR